MVVKTVFLLKPLEVELNKSFEKNCLTLNKQKTDIAGSIEQQYYPTTISG